MCAGQWNCDSTATESQASSCVFLSPALFSLSQQAVRLRCQEKQGQPQSPGGERALEKSALSRGWGTRGTAAGFTTFQTLAGQVFQSCRTALLARCLLREMGRGHQTFCAALQIPPVLQFLGHKARRGHGADVVSPLAQHSLQSRAEHLHPANSP